VIPVQDAPIPVWTDALPLPGGRVGELTVRGPVVSRRYHGRPVADAFAKIRDGAATWHRTGDLGYFDAEGRIWLCGRKAHRVWTRWGPLDTLVVEGIFNAHPEVARTALVGLGPKGNQHPVLCVEPKEGLFPRGGPDRTRFIESLRELGRTHEGASEVETFLFHRRFPVDIRHNAKIFREKLGAWAARRIRSPEELRGR